MNTLRMNPRFTEVIGSEALSPRGRREQRHVQLGRGRRQEDALRPYCDSVLAVLVHARMNECALF